MELEVVFTEIIKAATALTWHEVSAVFFSLLYVIYAAKNHAICWVFGIIGCAFWAYCAFFLYDLWLDAGLQVLYIGISFLGIYRWLYGKEKSELPITKWSFKTHLGLIIGGVFLSVLAGMLFKEYTPAAATYPDAFTTVFSIIATFMVIQRKLENWIYWMVIDAVYVFLYAARGGWLFSVLFVLYLGMAVYGYFNWRKLHVGNLD